VLINLYVNRVDGTSNVKTAGVLTMVPILIGSGASYRLKHVQESLKIKHPRQDAVPLETDTQYTKSGS